MTKIARNMPVARISRISKSRSSGIRDATKSSMRDGRLRHAAQPAFPDALGFLAGAAILNYLEDRLGRLAQFEFDCNSLSSRRIRTFTASPARRSRTQRP